MKFYDNILTGFAFIGFIFFLLIATLIAALSFGEDKER